MVPPGIPVVDKPLLFRLFLLLRYVLPQQGSPSAESTESIEPNWLNICWVY